MTGGVAERGWKLNDRIVGDGWLSGLEERVATDASDSEGGAGFSWVVIGADEGVDHGFVGEEGVEIR